MTIHRPAWFSESTVMISTAATCGLTKGGRLLPLVDRSTGRRVQGADPETGAMVDVVNDELLIDMTALRAGGLTDTLRFIPVEKFHQRIAVPNYYDHRYAESFTEALTTDSAFDGFTFKTIGEMIEQGLLLVRGGHGSPGQDARVGDVPYIKVSDLRAGLVNINPTNRVPRTLARRQFWRGDDSGLLPFDLLCPERTSKNIGDFCVLMPGQESVVLTKEVIVLRSGPDAHFDNFYLLWAMTLKIVRDQWKRVVFMQTNREDVGKRYYELLVPIPPDEETAESVSEAFRSYYTTMAKARGELISYLETDNRHHFFIAGGPEETEGDFEVEPSEVEGVGDIEETDAL